MRLVESLRALPVVPRFVSDQRGWEPLETIGQADDAREWEASEVRNLPGDPSGCRVFQLAPLNDGGYRDEPGAIFVAG